MTKSHTIKKLKLNRETIRTLTPDQLDGVGGGTFSEISISLISVTISVIRSLVRTE